MRHRRVNGNAGSGGAGFLRVRSWHGWAGCPMLWDFMVRSKKKQYLSCLCRMKFVGFCRDLRSRVAYDYK